MVTVPDVKALFAAGAHFGHRTSRWHPKMAPYIHSKRGGIHIIDLERTHEQLREAAKFAEGVAAEGKLVLFVGTKRQARPIVEQAARGSGMPFVSERWLGGMLTNFQTILKRVQRLRSLEQQMASGELAGKYSKLEVLRLQGEIDSLNRNFGGIKDMSALPGAVFVADVHGEPTAVREAVKLSIPVIGIVDSNTDPSLLTVPIPANDDAIKALLLITETIAAAVKEGKSRAKPAEEPEKGAKDGS
jgi:small subunit ribosomal protein S2